MFTARQYSYDPYEDYASSPAASSSPAPCVDSSPPSSPGNGPMEFDTVDFSPRIIHPLAASAKANRTPREYERKPSYISLSSSPVPHSPRKRQRLYDSDDDLGSISLSSEDDFDLSLETIVPPNFNFEDHDAERITERIWEEAIDEAVEYGRSHIDLSKHELTHIPPKIGDLSHFTALAEDSERNNAPPTAPKSRSFMRVKSAPVRASKDLFLSNSARTRSIDEVAMGASRQAIYLYLHNNLIKRIPMELLAVKKLQVLSLRGNGLKYIPPEICVLHNLAELSVANNQLSFLPAEIQQIKLRQLSVTPNPFLKPGRFGFAARSSSSKTLVNGATRLERVVSPIRTIPPAVIKLTELCLRLLLTPDPEDGVLEPPLCLNHAFAWTVDGLKLPPSDTANILRTYMPRPVTGSRSAPLASIQSAFLPGPLPYTDLGVCPAVSHTEPSYFVQHMEERVIWEDRVAGVPMTELVPLLWRGCQHGCLEFLAEDEPDVGDMDGGSVDEEGGDTEFEDGEDVQPKQICFSSLLDGEDLAEFEDLE